MSRRVDNTQNVRADLGSIDDLEVQTLRGVSFTASSIETTDVLVSGTATYVDTSNFSVQDALILLANNNTVGDVVDIGFHAKYGATTKYCGLARDASDGVWKLFSIYPRAWSVC